MGFNLPLAERIRQSLAGESGIIEKRMFGGLCFLHHGNMICGVTEDLMIARVGPAAYAAALEEEHTRPMDFTGKPMKGMIYVLPSGTRRKTSVKKWIDKCLAFTSGLPKK